MGKKLPGTQLLGFESFKDKAEMHSSNKGGVRRVQGQLVAESPGLTQVG